MGADALYGNNREFLNALEDAGENFMADIHSNHKVWLECPALSCPTKAKAKSGRPAERFKLKSGVDESRHQWVDKIRKDHFESDSVEVSFRQGSEGKLTGRFHTRVVWIWDGKGKSRPRERTLLIREDESGDLKYSLIKIPAGTSLARLAYIQNQRYWIEHCFH